MVNQCLACGHSDIPQYCRPHVKWNSTLKGEHPMLELIQPGEVKAKGLKTFGRCGG